MKRTLLPIIVLLSITAVYAQKEKTLVGDAWIGTVEYANEATREIKLVNPNKKTETFVGFLPRRYGKRWSVDRERSGSHIHNN